MKTKIYKWIKWLFSTNYWEKVEKLLIKRPKCIEITFKYENGRINTLTGSEATDYFEYLWYMYYGSNDHTRLMRERKWNWIEKDEKVVD